MAIWILKAAVQKTISILPFKERINFFFQRHITKAVKLSDEHFNWKVNHAKDHINHFCFNGGTINNKIVVELGTGWYPIIPIAMFLNGAKKVISYDIQNWLTKDTIITSIERLVQAKNNGSLPIELSADSFKRWSVLTQIVAEKDEIELNEMKSRLLFETKIQDARSSGLPNESIDLICSNNTFEHIFQDVLQGILIEFKRILKKDGRMSHFIDLTDHFAHFDKSISTYNYLKFSKLEWRIIDNDIQPQNRLRWFEYKIMYDSLGLNYKEEQVRPGTLSEIQELKVHSDYKDVDLKELAISHGYLCTN